MESLRQRFTGVEAKYLSAVHAPRRSNQHEIGSNAFVQILGNSGERRIRTRYLSRWSLQSAFIKPAIWKLMGCGWSCLRSSKIRIPMPGGPSLRISAPILRLSSANFLECLE